MLQCYDFLFHKISDEVVPNVNMFGPAVLDGILGDIDGTEIITEQCHDILSDIGNNCFQQLCIQPLQRTGIHSSASC